MESGSRNSNQDTKVSSSESKKKASKKMNLTKQAQRNSQNEVPQNLGLPPSEEVGSFLENIKTEWSLFWAGLAGEDEKAAEETEIKFEDPFETGKLRVLTIEQVKKITRALSQDRKKINQRIEQINREIELNSERMESINLVGGDANETIDEINKLNDLGMKLSLQLQKVNLQLDRFRIREDELKGLR